MDKEPYAEPGPEWTWQLLVVQHIMRGRKCGFGDRDRRPVTPPLVVQLIVRRSQQEYDIVPPDDIDVTFYVVAADLRHADGSDANLIASSRLGLADAPPSRSADGGSAQSSANAPSYNGGANRNQDIHQASTGYSYGSHNTGDIFDSTLVQPTDVTLSPNLIGSLHTGLHKLNDLNGNRGLFAIFNDLSVRSEGTFRIRLRVLSIGHHGARAEVDTPVLATVMTEPFHVTSAKQFEGMVDPTELSKCFAAQGVRIPVRKAPKRKVDEQEQEL